MAKTRHLFTLSSETSEILKEQKNKSEFIEKAVNHFYHSKSENKKETPQLKEVEVLIG